MERAIERGVMEKGERGRDDVSYGREDRRIERKERTEAKSPMIAG